MNNEVITHAVGADCGYIDFATPFNGIVVQGPLGFRQRDARREVQAPRIVTPSLTADFRGDQLIGVEMPDLSIPPEPSPKELGQLLLSEFDERVKQAKGQPYARKLRKAVRDFREYLGT